MNKNLHQPETLGQEAVNVYRAWDTLSRAPDPEDYKRRIIDIDVAPRVDNPLEFHSTDEVKAALEDLSARAGEDEEGLIIRQKVNASLMHLRVLDGEEVPFEEQVEASMKITPELVDEAELDKQQARLDRRLREHGLRFDREDKEKFEEKLVIRSADKIRKQFFGATHWTGKIVVKDFTGLPAPSIKPTIKPFDAEWIGGVSTDDEGNLVETLNSHAKHKYTLGRIAAVAAHETGGHVLQFETWRQAILHGEMSPIAGLTTLHTPENVQAEGFAQLVEQLALRSVKGKDAWKYLFTADYHDYKERVWNNAHIKINSGTDEAEVLDYLAKRLPFEPIENLRKFIPSRRDDPTERVYSLAYEPSLAIVRPILHMAPGKQKRLALELMKRPLTPAQMRQVVSGKLATTALAA